MEFWRRQWHPTPVFLPGKSHGRRSLVGCRPWGRKESDTTKQLHFHFSLSCIGEGNGNPLQCSCLENPRDGKPGGLPSMGLHRVRHNWSNLAAAAYTEFRKMVTITLYTRQQKRHWCIEQSFGLFGRGRGWDDLGEWHWNMYNIIYEMSRQSRFDARYWMLGAGALGRPRGMV